jgi:aspartate carbamoyltransferase catalytic subunit
MYRSPFYHAFMVSLVWAGGDKRLEHRLLGSIFFEPSTRTASSFQAAFQVGLQSAV